jgi:hypothetical protein
MNATLLRTTNVKRVNTNNGKFVANIIKPYF